MQVAGLLAPPPSHGILAAVVAEQPAGQLLATGLDAPALREQLQQPALAPRVLRLDPAAPLGYARDLAVLPNTLPAARPLDRKSGVSGTSGAVRGDLGGRR